MFKKLFKSVILPIVILLLYSVSVTYAEENIDDDWVISGGNDKSKWTWNEEAYFIDERQVTSDKTLKADLPIDVFNKIKEYIDEGYEINYRVKFDTQEVSSANLKVYFSGEGDVDWFGRGEGIQDEYETFYHCDAIKHTTSTPESYFTENKTSTIRRFDKQNDMKIHFDTGGDGEDKINVKNVIFQFVIYDEVPPKITGMKYYDNYMDYKDRPDNYIKYSDHRKLSFNGSYNYIDMVVEFDEEVKLCNDIATNYIKTNMAMTKDGEKTNGTSSFKYVEQDYLPKNTLVFRYKVAYGDYAREVDRDGLENKKYLDLCGKNALIENLKEYEVKDKYNNEIGSSEEHVYSSVAGCKITIDGDPPEITEVLYDVKKLEGEKNKYLKAGDSVEVKVRLNSLLDNEKISVNSNGYFPFNNGAEADLVDEQSDGYGKNDWITYIYTVDENDEDTNCLAHLITETYENDPVEFEKQVKQVAIKMGIRDDYGNIAEMQKSGEGDSATALFPAVALKVIEEGVELDKNIFIDTTLPKVNFNYGKNCSTYKNEQIVNMKPVEKGSMLGDGGFYYVISKSPNHPTNGSLSSNLGAKFYPYTRAGDNPNSGYSDTSNAENIEINDILYDGIEGYTQYDGKYDPINKTGTYDNVNYIDGTASDVVYDGRREITGMFYIHTYMEDKSGNKSWQTSQPIYVDNTHPNIKLLPIGTNQYVGDLNINFELLEEVHAGFEKYEYRWISPLDLDGKNIDIKEMYTENTYTYNLLRDSSKYWKMGTLLDSYFKSNIPIPSFEERQHGASYLLIRAYDKAGNISYIVSEPYYFDKEKPVVTFESESGGFDQPVLNHKVKVKINDKHSKLIEFKYYFSNDNVIRDKDAFNRDEGDKIWKQLKLELPDLPEDYDPFNPPENYDPSNDEDYKNLLIKEATLETDDWNEEDLNGYVFLHVYAKDICGNEIYATQDMILDNNGLPIVGFEYDNEIENRYKNVVGHIKCSDDGGIETLEYKWSQSTEILENYTVLSILGLDPKNFKVDTPEFNQDGEWYLHVRATDKYGNVTNSVSNKYTISSKAPDINIFEIDNNEVILSNDKNIALKLNKLVDDKLEYTYVVYSDAECNTEVKRGTFSSTSEIVNIQLDNSTSEIQDYYFKFYDSLDQITENALKIEAIYDNVPPTAELVYSPSKEGGTVDSDVTVTLSNIVDNSSNEKDIVVSEKTYTFTENGEHLFTVTDKAGNINTYVAKVTWIQDDKPIARLNTNNICGQQYKSVSFTLTAERPTDGGYVNIKNPEIYYQFTKSEQVLDKDWIKYNNGDTVTYDNENGEYYLHTKLVDGKRSFTSVFGKYVLDNIVNEPVLTYSYIEEGKSKELTQEEYNALTEINSAVTVKLSFDEDAIIKSVTDSEGNELPKEKVVNFNKNAVVTVTYIDKAGNEGCKAIEINKINNANTPTFTLTPNTMTNGEVTVKIDAPDNKVINNIRFNDKVVDSVIFTKLDKDKEDKNYAAAEFKVNENGKIKVDILEIDGTEVIATVEYTIINIDKVAPTGNIIISNVDSFTRTATIEITDESSTSVTKVEFEKEDGTLVEFTAENNDAVEGVIYNNITHTITTKINGTVKYYFEDSVGNKGETQKAIGTINTKLDMDKVSATYKVDGDSNTYDTVKSIGVVNKNVTVTLNMPDGYNVVNNSGKNTRTFVVGMKYDFLISNGINIDKFSIDLTNTIKKSGPALKLKYTINSEDYIDKLVDGKTSKNVLLTITSDDNISKVEFDGVEVISEPFSYEFTQNKVVTVVATDNIGNTSFLKASVDCIDKEPVRAGLFSLYTMPTNEENIKLQFLSTKRVDVLEIKKNGSTYKEVENGESVDKYEFNVDNNGRYSVRYKDDIGNENTVNLVVSNFDREAPKVKLTYNGEATKSFTKEDVLVTVQLKDAEQELDGIKVLNTIGNIDSYLFKENGKFTYRVSDTAGNITEITANVDNIDREPPSYTINYSETELTKKDVIVTVTVDENNYKILNKDINRSINKNVTVNGRDISVKFDDNGYYQLSISDIAGNAETILLRVRNIDRIKPTIELLNKYVVTLNGEMPDLNDFIAYDTHDGNVDDKVNISRLNVTTPGDKTITYTVSDTAGNETEVDRIVKVVGNDFTVIVDGKENPVPFISLNEEVDIKVFNFIENFETKFLRASGAVKDGVFKQGGQALDKVYDTIDDLKPGKSEMKFSASQTGWHTIYIRDLNRQTSSFTIYFTKTK
ncbi:immunoglobulin-like domain-containing protein [Abyssisolibacter fermentans]|uniref:immunoglobulin-like domain-containing protein n=1 Tax=Abyssisolibacter fermentans TaxID=1766203 RepID=UPI00082B484B|nr:immunoglobulin-like domain-containing protein [Abyssisolibacter fermentans]